MKKVLLLIIFSLYVLLSFAFNSTTLSNSVAIATNETNEPDIWYDATTTTIDVTDINKILVLASFDMWPTGTDLINTRIAEYRLYCDGEVTTDPLIRQLQASSSYLDHGMGSQCHIFDVSTLSGTISVKLQHLQSIPLEQALLTTQTELSVIALTTNTGVDLSSDNKTGTVEDGTSSTTFQLVDGLNTNAIELPLNIPDGDGAIYICAAFSTKGYEENSSSVTGEWQLQSSTDNNNWHNIGTSINRTMSNNGDEGITSLVAVEDNLNGGSHYFRLVSRRVSSTEATVKTLRGSELIAVALNYNDEINGSGRFPYINSISTSEQSNSTNTYSTAGSSSFTSVNSTVDILLHSQFNMIGNTTFNSAYELNLNDNPTFSTTEQERYISGSSDLGSGVLIGLINNVPANSSYTANLKHKIDEDPTGKTLTTSNVILAGFQLSSSEVEEVTLPIELSSFSAIAISENSVSINWTVQSESNMVGYYILKGNMNLLNNAELLPHFIPATNTPLEYSYSFTDTDIEEQGEYYYWLKSLDLANESEFFGPSKVTIDNHNNDTLPTIPWKTQLQGNYPNPFNPSTEILFSVKEPELVKIDIYNIKGQLVKNLFEEHVSITNQSIKVPWNSRDNLGNAVSSGIYYIKMKAGSYTETAKMILSK